MSGDQISEEVLGDVALQWFNDGNLSPDLQCITLTNDLFPLDTFVVGTCDYQHLAQCMEVPFQANELDTYLGPSGSQPIQLEHDNYRALRHSTPIKSEKSVRKVKHTPRQIPLSQSVGVGPQIPSKSHHIELVNELEEFYRPRYKSDYFTQDGKVRKPRYVTDRYGNHFVSLKVPTGCRGKIRVDWLTTATESGDRYSMPYRFQVDNNLQDVPDANPIYVDIESNNSGIMKFFLVLIKSKQDELKVNSVLKPFRPLQDAFGVETKKVSSDNLTINPKQLIQKYQLEKSQLAFTLCSSGMGGSIVPEWDTTVYSTILTEMAAENVKRKKVRCPNCSHTFSLSPGSVDDDDDNYAQETNIHQQLTTPLHIQPTSTKRKVIHND